MRRLLSAVLVVAALGIAGFVGTMATVTRTGVDSALVDWARTAGATLRVEGGAAFALLPTPRVVATDVRLSLPGVAEVRAGTMEIVAHPASVLHGRFVPGDVRLVGAAVATTDGAAFPTDALARTGGVEIVDGRLVQTGGRPDLPFSGSVRGTGDGVLSAEIRVGAAGAVAVSATVGPAAGEGRRAVRVRATRGNDTVRFEGERAGPVLAGSLAVSAPGLAQTLAALDLPADVLPVRAADVTGSLRIDGAGWALEGLRGQVDVGEVAGSLRWGRDGLTGRLDGGRVPVERLLPAAVALTGTSLPVALDLRLAGLTWGEVDLGVSAVSVRRAGPVLALSLGDAALFDGSVAARVEAIAGPAGPSITGELRLNALDTERLLRALGMGPAAAGELRGHLNWELPPGSAPWQRRLVGAGTFVLTGGRIGAGVFGLSGPLPLDGLSGSLALGGTRATLSSVGLVAPPQRFAGRGTVDLGTGALDLAFAPVGTGEGPLPRTGFRLRGPFDSARIEGAPVAAEGPAPAFPARSERGERAQPAAPPTPIPGGGG